jgi:hypothetical protein
MARYTCPICNITSHDLANEAQAVALLGTHIQIHHGHGHRSATRSGETTTRTGRTATRRR